MRIGIHSGACMAGIVVTLANKMESNSKPGQVHISDETKRCLYHYLSNYMMINEDGNGLYYEYYCIMFVPEGQLPVQ
ncbi:unnamed protein product [Medioppia subpectinata]|uniref:Guanylate cyclase domain-containing protein n=1 Tax=Medioppia subpectinata TaxID=1979941 RepID=A0A7R9LB02_9ACAR|nr:unnamed protein product [Medioppia subpectinata]CAG2117396.1 unnamed protein product [Medioppia subpectinata]